MAMKHLKFEIELDNIVWNNESVSKTEMAEILSSKAREFLREAK